MAKHNPIATSPVTSPSSPHLTSRYPTDDDDEEPNEMVVMFIDWEPAAVNLFLEKWASANLPTPPPFDRPDNIKGLQRRLLEHLTQDISGASVISTTSIDCNALALALLTAAMAHLEKNQWVRSIIDAQPVGWNSRLGAIYVAYNGKSERVRFGDNRMFE